ncbi:MAG: cation-transporting P-type ATPase, partial [Candidatus Bathyarchaeia archaeon]
MLKRANRDTIIFPAFLIEVMKRSFMEWHSLKPREIVQQLETDPKQGLDDAEAKRRLEKFG